MAYYGFLWGALGSAWGPLGNAGDYARGPLGALGSIFGVLETVWESFKITPQNGQKGLKWAPPGRQARPRVPQRSPGLPKGPQALPEDSRVHKNQF